MSLLPTVTRSVKKRNKLVCLCGVKTTKFGLPILEYSRRGALCGSNGNPGGAGFTRELGSGETSFL